MLTAHTTDHVVLNKVQEDIIHAALQHFLIPEDVLISGTTFNITYMRMCIFYLVKNNTELSERLIGNRLKRKRNAVRNGIEVIEARSRVKHRQTVDDLKKISELAALS